MLRALVPLVAGIIIADVVMLPLWGLAIGLFVCVAVAIMLHRRSVSDLYIIAALILTGMFSMELRREQCTTLSHTTTMEITIDNITSRRTRATMADARLVAYHSEQGYRRSRSEVRVVAEPQLAIENGDRLLVRAKINPFDEQEPYGRNMLGRGVAGQLFINRENLLERRHDTSSLPQRLRSWAVERVRGLHLDQENEVVVMAMSIAERSGITPSLRQAYTRAGAAHLLAVSGLHVGFICAIANLLLAWLILLPYGQVLRSIGVVTLIWLFAAMAGFIPSIVRAAVMFSLLQVALQVSARVNMLNTLCFTAFVMLVWDARMLHDAGFLLSFISVAAIIEWGVPLFPQRRRAIAASVWRWFASGVVASTVAAIATLPLTAYLFGSVSLWSIVTGVLMVALAAVTVGAAMLWILFPIEALQGVASWVLAGVTDVMNGVAAWCNSVGVLALDIDIEGCLCRAIYLVMVVVTIIVWAARGRN